MAGIGLSALGTAPVGAGLGDDNATMWDRERAMESLRMLGSPVPPSPADTMVDADDGMGLGGVAMYGGRSALEGMLQGAGDLASDYLGADGTRDALYDAGQFVAPTEEQDARRAARDEDRGLLGDAVDGAVSEVLPMVGTIGAGAAAGAAAGSVVPVIGTAIGAGVGAATAWGIGYLRGRDETRDKAKLYKAQQLFGPEPTPEQIAATTLSPEDMQNVETAAVGGAMLDAVTPLKVLRRVAPGAAGNILQDAVQRGVGKAVLKKGAADAFTEGATEVGQLALQELMLNPELAKRMSEGEAAETAKWIAQEFGREAAVSFLAGMGLGGAMGAGSGAYEQSFTNAKRKNDIQTLGRAGQEASVELAEFENASRDPKRVGQMADDADRLRRATSQLERMRKARDEYAAQPEAERNPEYLADLEASVEAAQSRYDTAHDEIMPNYGGMKLSDMRARREQVEQEVRRSAKERAVSNGFVLEDDADPVTINSALEPLEAAKADLASAIRKRDTTTDERFKSKYAKQAAEAKQQVRAAEINARRTIYGESPEEAATQLDREAGVRRHRERLFGSESDPNAVIEQADAVIAERNQKAKVTGATQKQREKIARLYEERDAAESETKIQEIETKIAKEQAKLKQPDPLVEAATRAKRDAYKALGLDPAVLDTADLSVTADDQGAQEAEVEPSVTDNTGEASTEAAPVPTQEGLGPDPVAEATPAPAPDATPDEVRAAVEAVAPTVAGREPATTADGVELPEAPGSYIASEGNDTVDVPLTSLRGQPGRTSPSRIRSAGQAMRRAYDGISAPRSPLSVRAEADGTYTVLEGNATLANAAQAGWSEIPVRVVTDAQFAAERAPSFGRETGTRVTADGDTLVVRGLGWRREAIENRAAQAGLKVRYEPTDAVPGQRRPQLSNADATPQNPWRDLTDEVGAGADLDDVTEQLRRADPRDEHMAVFDADGQLLAYGTNDLENGVAIPLVDGQRITSGTILHNHPEPTPFSVMDLTALWGRDPETFASQVLTDGHIIEIRPTEVSQAMSMGDIRQYGAELIGRVVDAIPDGTFAAGTPRVRQEAALRIADAEGIINYSRPFETLTSEEESYVEAIVDEALARAAEAAAARGAVGRGNDAAAGPAAGVQGQPAGGSGAGRAPDDAGEGPVEAAAGIDDVNQLNVYYNLPPAALKAVSPLATGDLPVKALKGNGDAALYLEGRFRDAGLKPITKMTTALPAAEIERIAKTMAMEAEVALAKSGSAQDWYTGAMARSVEVAATRWPMLQDDAAAAAAGLGTAANARFAFTYAMAVTSQNLTVSHNVKQTILAFDDFLQRVSRGDFSFDPNFASGEKQQSMAFNFAKFKPLLDAQPGATMVEKLTALDAMFRQRRPVSAWVKDMEAAGIPYSKPGQTAMDAEVYGSSLLGPKIGNGFWQNLNGNYSPVTIDLWMRRTWGRMTGASMGLPEAWDSQKARLKQSAQRSFQQAGAEDAREETQVALNNLRVRLAAAEAATYPSLKERNATLKGLRAEINATTEALADIANTRVPLPWPDAADTDTAEAIKYAKKLKNAWDKEFRARNEEIKAKLGKKATLPADVQPTWARAAKAIVASQTKPIDTVANGTQRKQIEKAVDRAIQLLNARGINLSPADLQAVLWYPEKDLWNSLTKKLDVDADGNPIPLVSPLNESYDTAFEAQLRELANGEPDQTGDGSGGDGAGAQPLLVDEGDDPSAADEGGLSDVEVAANLDAKVADLGRAGQAVARGARGGSRRLADGSLAPLAGAPTIRGHKGPIQDLVRVAEQYAESIGIELVPQAEFVDVDVARARRIADAYEAMPHAPQDPVVAEAYQNLIEQTTAQYNALVDNGYSFFFFAPDSPYGESPATAMEDLRLNRKMGVFPTDSGFGTGEFDPAENPLLADTGLTWPDEQGIEQTVYANDLFRAVHDAFGHGLEGAGFRAKGEENAWQAHVRLFTGSARGAITSETRGQNSWLNYGPHGETNQTAAVTETHFADQKTGLMPEWTWTEGIAADAPDVEIANGQDRNDPQAVRRASGRNGAGQVFLEETGRPVIEAEAETFAQALSAAREALGSVGRQVALFDPAEHPNARTFLLDDGMSGFAIDDGNLIAVFTSPDSPRGAVRHIMPMAIQQGANRLDAFDTFLPKLYSKLGFREVARVPFDRQYAPEGWNYDALGEPDIVYMVHDPDGSDRLGNVTDDMDVAVAAQNEALGLEPAGTVAIEFAGNIDSDAFRNWFGDSKVVNKDGTPKVVYHGSTQQGITAFDTTRVTTRGSGDEAGTYFTDDGLTASNYTRPPRGTPATGRGQLHHVYLSLQNPLDTTADIKRFQKRGMPFKDAKRKALEKLDRTVHDGIMFRGDSYNPAEYVAFQPTQIKSVKNPGGWDANDPEIMANVDLPDYLDIGWRDTTSTFKDMIEVAKRPRGAAERLVAATEDKFFNGFAPIRRLEIGVTGKLAEGAESAYKAAEMAVNDAGRQEALLFYGAAKLGAHGEFTVAPGTKGLRTIFDEVAGPDRNPQNLADWMAFMAAERAEDLHKRGIATPLTAQDIADARAKATPAFRQAAADWKAHNDANIDFLVDTDRITPAQAAAMKAEQHYVPFYRSDKQTATGNSPEFSLDEYLGNGGGSRAGSGALMKRDPGIKKIVGGDKMAIDNLMLNMLRNSQAMVAAGMRNRAANQTFDLMEMAGLATSVKATKVSKKTGNIVRKEKPANSVRMWIGGNEKFVVVEEEGAPLVAAMGGLHPRQRGALEQLMIQIAAVFRQGITITPAFMIRNAIRGAVSTGLMTSGANLTAGNNFFTGFMDAMRKGDATQAFKHMSGMGDYRFGSEDAGFGQNDILIEYGLAPKTIMSRLRAGLNKAEAVGTGTELADRVAAYKTWTANGVRPDEAAYQALTIMNYGRRGNSSVVQVMVPMIPFLNARLQGLSRMAEGAVGRRGALPRKRAMLQLALNGAVLSAASLALWAWNNDDEEKREKYLAEPLFRRLNYHPIYVGDRTIYIPKAFELGAIFSSIPEIAADGLFNDMGDEVAPAMKSIVAQTFLFNAIPAAILPAIEGFTNYSFFRGSPIEGARESNLRARDRITGASPLTIALGQKLGVSDATNMSPAMLEHALQGYGGAYYHMLSAAVEMVGQELGLSPSTPMGPVGAVPVVSPAIERSLGSLIKSEPMQTGKYIEEFYRAKTHLDQIYLSAKEAATNGDIEYARSLLVEAPGLPAARKIINKASQSMGDLNAAIRVTRLDKTLTREQKAAKMAPLIKARNELSRIVVKAVEQIETAQGRKFAQVA